MMQDVCRDDNTRQAVAAFLLWLATARGGDRPAHGVLAQNVCMAPRGTSYGLNRRCALSLTAYSAGIAYLVH